MKYINSIEIAKIWGITDRSVRSYCAQGRVDGAYIEGKTWMIPSDAQMPKRLLRRTTIRNINLLKLLKEEKDSNYKNGLYSILQIAMTYNSNHIEGNTLDEEQVRSIFETNIIKQQNEDINVDDIIETLNHFRCIDLAIDVAKSKLSEYIIKQFHRVLKNGTSDAQKSWFKIGDYKLLANEVGGNATAKPEDVKIEMAKLIDWYNSIQDVKIEDIIEFHQRFESIHPFQDGNGRVGRLIMFKECLKHKIPPIIILDKCKTDYYAGLQQWDKDKSLLIDTCKHSQETTKKYLRLCIVY